MNNAKAQKFALTCIRNGFENSLKISKFFKIFLIFKPQGFYVTIKVAVSEADWGASVEFAECS